MTQKRIKHIKSIEIGSYSPKVQPPNVHELRSGIHSKQITNQKLLDKYTKLNHQMKQLYAIIKKQEQKIPKNILIHKGNGYSIRIVFVFLLALYGAVIGTLNYIQSSKCTCEAPEIVESLQSLNDNTGLCSIITECDNGSDNTIIAAVTTLPVLQTNLTTIMSCGTGNVASLTFDDGPEFASSATTTIMTSLNNLGIKGTFYVSPNGFPGDLTQKCTIVKTLVDNGHEVQSHSWSHPNFKTLTNNQIYTELTTVSDWIYSCSGNQVRPTIFRPPFGELHVEQARYINSLGYIIGLWNIDTNDWRSPNNFTLINSGIQGFNGGANAFLDGNSITILMHDSNSYNIIPEIVSIFTNEGYTFVNQSQCYARCDTIDVNGICREPDTNGYTHYIINEWGL